jgi:hypothetical protein
MNSILLIASFFAAHAYAQADLGADARLATTVEVSAPCVTLAELLQQVSGQSGVPLTAAQDVEETLVVVRWRGPARDLLHQLGDYFQWTWGSDGAGYRLARSEQRRKEEEELWKRERVAALGTLRELLEKEIQKASQPLTEEELLRIREVRRALEALGNRSDDQKDWEASIALSQELSKLLSRTDPARTLAMLALVEASEDAILELAKGRVVTFADRPHPRQHPLGPRGRALAQRLVGDFSEASRAPRETVGEASPLVTTPLTIPFSTSDVHQVAVEVRVVSFMPGSAFHSSARVIIASKDGRTLASVHASMPTDWQTRSRGLQDLPKDDLLQTPARRADVQRALDAGENALKIEPCSLFGHLLLFLADRAKKNLICEASDAYPVAHLDTVDGATVGDYFTQLSKLLGLHVEERNGALLVRQHVAPMWARRLTTPRSILRPFLAELNSAWGVPFDRLASIVARLSDEQASHLPNVIYAAIKVVPSHPSLAERDTLEHIRFWASLPEPIRQRLAAGEVLTYGSLPAEARARLLALADHLSGFSNGLFGTISLPPAVRQAWGETIELGYRTALVERRVINTTVRLPRDLPPDTQIRLVRAELPAIGFEHEFENQRLRQLLSAHDAGRWDFSPEGPGGVPAWGLYLGTAEVQALGIILPDGFALISSATSLRLVEGARPLKRDELPEPVRQAMEEGRRQMRGGGAP